MTISMTGFAARKGQGAAHAWTWDLRSVNGKGLDLRIRVPDWIEGLEMLLRSDLAKALQRGSVSLSLKVANDAGTAATDALQLNPAALKSVLTALSQVEEEAMSQGITLRQATSAGSTRPTIASRERSADSKATYGVCWPWADRRSPPWRGPHDR